MKTLLACAFVALTVGAGSTLAECPDQFDDGIAKYKAMMTKRDELVNKVKADADGIHARLPGFLAAIEAYRTANMAVRSQGESTERNAARETAFAAVMVELREIGTYQGTWDLDTVHFFNFHERIIWVRNHIYRAFEQCADAKDRTDKWWNAFNLILEPSEADGTWARDHILAIDTPSKRFQGWYLNETARAEWAGEMHDYEVQCGAVVDEAREAYDRERQNDATEIANASDHPSEPATGDTTGTTGTIDLAAATGESNVSTGGTADTTGTGSKRVPDSPDATGTTSTDVFTVGQGDNLWKIAKSLSARFGQYPTNDVVRSLYAHLVSKSNGNPSLIFPGDTIDLKAVAEELAG